MTTTKIIVWFIALVVLLTPVLASEDTSMRSTGLQLTPFAEDFTASGTARIIGFSCSPAEGSIIVKNTGTVLTTFDLTAEGKARDWVQFAPQAFSLLPDQTQIVKEYFNIPCDAEDTTLDVVITSTELELVLSQDIIVQTPNNLELKPVVYSQSILPCDPATFSFVLSNPATFTETYSLHVEDAPEQTALSDESLTLLPKTNETIAITIQPKDCSLAGDFTPVLVVNTEKTKLSAEIDMFLRVNDSDIPEIAKDITNIRAGLEAQEAKLKITNTGNRITTYLLSIDGADWVNVQPEQITIDPRESEDIKLILRPTETTTEGTYKVTLTALVETTGKEYTKELTIKLGEPTLAEKLFAEYLPFTIGGIVLLVVIIILIIAGVKKYNSPEAKSLRAERRAERERIRQERQALKEKERKAREEEKQRKEKQDAKEAERKERLLERERLKAQKQYDKQLRRENLVISKEAIVKGRTKSKILFKLLFILLLLILIGFGLSIKAAIAKNIGAVLAGIGVLLVILILHRIRRQRIVRKRWKLALANHTLHFATKWRKGITELAFKLGNVVEKLKVTIKRGKLSVPSPSKYTYQTFTITPNTEQNIVTSAKLTFRIKKSWLLRNHIAPGTVSLAQFNGKWQNHRAEQVSTDDKYAYYTVNVDSLGEFAIVGKTGKSKKTERHIGRWIGLTLFCIIALIALFSLVLLIPEQKQKTIGIPAQVWQQDQQYTLDLAQYFKDPDNDKLTFTVTRTEKIDITIIDSKAILTPSHGWAGTERVVFTADDGKNATVKSNPVDLVVEKPAIPRTWKVYAQYAFGSAIALLLFIGLVMLGKRILSKK